MTSATRLSLLLFFQTRLGTPSIFAPWCKFFTGLHKRTPLDPVGVSCLCFPRKLLACTSHFWFWGKICSQESRATSVARCTILEHQLSKAKPAHQASRCRVSLIGGHHVRSISAVINKDESGRRQGSCPGPAEPLARHTLTPDRLRVPTLLLHRHPRMAADCLPRKHLQRLPLPGGSLAGRVAP
jgi:hypothetical protein